MEENDANAKRTLLTVRLLTYGSRKPPGRARYICLLHMLDTVLLRLLGKFGASSTIELEDLAKAERPRRFALLTAATVADWLTTAARRGLVMTSDESSEPDRWLLTARGQARARGWRHRLESATGALVAFVKWLVPIALGGAVLGLLGPVDWKELWASDALLIALAVVGISIPFIVYSVLLRSFDSTLAVLSIELGRRVGEAPSLDVTEAAPSTV